MKRQKDKFWQISRGRVKCNLHFALMYCNVYFKKVEYLVNNLSTIENCLVFAEEKHNIDSRRKYQLTDEGYYLGENVTIECNPYIEPGCIIKHDVDMGSNVIKNVPPDKIVIGNLAKLYIKE